MEIPAHIVDAVHTSDESPYSRLEAINTDSQKSLRSARFPGLHRNAFSSVEDMSTTTDSDYDTDYKTDNTTPPFSTSGLEDMQPDDVESFRDREYPQLRAGVYLDHGGATLYAKSLIEDFSADLIANLYGNPHSASTPAAISGHRIDNIRERTLRFFGADPEHFDLVFVANATAAIKLVIDCFKDHAAASNTPVWYGYHRDAHTSLVGVREATKLHRCFTSDEEVELWINSGGLGGPRARQLGLFAYPGQSNMTGRRLPLNWPGRIRKTFHKAATYTLLDAAALACTAPLDLSDPATAPDFVSLSFYKIFGFPNIGALIVRKDSAHVLENRRYFGGGTVEMVITINDTWHAKKETSLHDRLEDGTLPFHSIFALDHAMSVHERLYGPNPMKFISHHTAQLGKQLYDGLTGLKHSNGTPLCRVYKDGAAVFGDPSVQGATIAFNVQQPDGSLVGFEEVEAAADERNIYVRSGSLCNPGGMATYLEWSPLEMRAAFAAGHRCSNTKQIVMGKATGVVRVSLGAMNIASDIQKFLQFLREVYVDQVGDKSQPSISIATKSADAARTLMGPTSPLSMPPMTPMSSHSEPPVTITSNPDGRMWESAHSALPTQQEDERPKYPAFVPADYIKMRKPWEAEMRKNSAYVAEVQVRDVDDGATARNNHTPSVKARRFGRSMVNLLRTKQSQAFIDPRSSVPTSPPPFDPPLRTDLSRPRSRRSLERQQLPLSVEPVGS